MIVLHNVGTPYHGLTTQQLARVGEFLAMGYPVRIVHYSSGRWRAQWHNRSWRGPTWEILTDMQNWEHNATVRRRYIQRAERQIALGNIPIRELRG